MSRRKLRILLFSTRGAGDHYFGPGMSAYRMYQHSDTKNVSLSLLHGYPEQPKKELFRNEYFICDLTKGGPLPLLNFMLRIKKWVRENHHNFDVVHCLGAFHPSFLVAYYFEKAGIPAFLKITESKHTGFTKSSKASAILGLKRFRQKNANQITGYISISSEITSKLANAGIEKSKIYSIPNGVNTERFRPVDKKEKLNLRNSLNLDNKFTVLFTGAFSYRKNPLLIAQAFKHFSGAEDIQLLLVGPDTDNGRHRKAIIDLIENNRLDNVIIREKVTNIEKYYQASDLFVLPSKEEGLSNSMLEAMACGLPVLVTRISGAEDVVKQYKNGAFIEPEPESILGGIKAYFDDRQLLKSNSDYAVKTILDDYKSDEIYQQYIKLFKNNVYAS